MKLTPAIKGQLTKAVKANNGRQWTFLQVWSIFLKVMPREQAKHATRKYLAV